MTFFRKNTHTIVWVIVLAFVLWGGSTFLVGTEFISPYAGEVFGKKIKLRDFEKQKKLVKFLLPDEYANLPDEVINQETFQQLALTLEAKKRGMTIHDSVVKGTIENLLGGLPLQGNIAAYERWTKSVLNEGPREFEEALRKTLLARQMMRELLREADAEPPEPEKWENLSEEDKKAYQNLQAQILFDFYNSADIKSKL